MLATANNPLVRPPRYRPKWPWILLGLIVGAFVVNHFFQFWPWPWTATPSPEAPKTVAVAPQTPSPVIDYGKIEDQSDLKLGEMILERKKEFGLKDSVDMVVEPDEAIRIGQETVPLAQILAAIESDAPEDAKLAAQLVGGALLEEDLTQTGGGAQADPRKPTKLRQSVQYYGIYVVRPGDNLWDIHFNYLREYFKNRGVDIPPTADEGASGQSSGVAKILKYAETMVHIFNMKTKRLDRNLDLLEPYEKVVVFNLTHLNIILGSLAPGQINDVHFDGRDIYLPQKTPAGGETAPSPTPAPSSPGGPNG